MYLGEAVGGDDLVYHSFMESVHVLPDSFVLDPDEIYQVYIGVDGATTQDKTVFLPIFHLKNAKMVVSLKDMLYHDPQKNGIITNNVMSKRYAKIWLKRLIEKYRLYQRPITMVIDGHANDLRENLEYELAPFGNLYIHKFTRKDLRETSDKVNNAFDEGLLYLTDESWKEIKSQDEVHQSKLFLELQTVCWREDKPDKFNDAIENDMSDALRYPIAYHSVDTPYQVRNFQREGSGS
jgi:hypothetical protein